MIRKVVLEKRTEQPLLELDTDIIYVREGVYNIERLYYLSPAIGFCWNTLKWTCYEIRVIIGFENVIKESKTTIYALKDLDELRRFIKGKRDFDDKIEPISSECDEVHIDDCSVDKIYAFQAKNYDAIFKLNRVGESCNSGEYNFIQLNGSLKTGGDIDTFKNKIIKIIKGEDATCVSPADVYQFDTPEEFFEWSLRQVRGK